MFTTIVSVLLLILGYKGNVKVPAFAESYYSPSPLFAERRSVLEHAGEKRYLHGPSLTSSNQFIQRPSPTT
jgi:hypothetical protein